MPADYQKGIIYKLCCKDIEVKDEYIGSTVQFIERRRQHKLNCNDENSRGFNLYVYKKIREYGGWDNWNMIEVQKFPCNDKREAEAREEYWRCHFNAQLNTIRAYTTVEQKKQYGIEYYKEYYEKNKDKYLEYNENNKDKISERKKQYYETHKDKILEKMKQYNYNKKNKTDSSSDDSTECITH